MKQRILFLGLVVLTLINIVDGLLMADFMSLIVALMLMFLADLARVDGKLRAPHAEKEKVVFGTSEHQMVYIKALKHCMLRINYDRANGGHLAPIKSYWYRKYVHDKWTYALVFRRYKESQKRYGWEYL